MSQPPPQSKKNMEQAGASDESIQNVHSILLRENAEPSEGYRPMPLFLLGFVSTMIFISAIYFVQHLGGFDPLVYDERFDPKMAGSAAAGPVELTPEQVIAQGKKLFNTCATCHQPTGKGVPGVYPPLAGSAWVQGSDELVVRILVSGLSGPLEVDGNTYNGIMPPFGATGYKWSDEKIAQVLTYVRQEWGNSAEPISTARVKEIREADNREAPWSAQELEAYQ